MALAIKQRYVICVLLTVGVNTYLKTQPIRQLCLPICGG